VDLEVIVNVA